MLTIAAIHINQFFNIFLWLAITIGFIYVIRLHIFEPYTIIGSCSIDLNTVRIKYKEHIEYIEFSEMVFIYGGYKGKDDGFNAIFTGSNVKSGANNYLVFKKENTIKVQIMLNSKKDYKDLSKKLTELKASGVKIEEERYLFFSHKSGTK